MQTTSDAYKAAIAAKVRVVRHRVLVAWGGDPFATIPAPGDELGDISRYVVDGSLDGSLTTDLPEETRLVTGYAAAKLTLTLSGDPRDNTRDATWLWSPYNTDSPYATVGRIGSAIVLQIGVETDGGPEWVTVFTGQLTKLQANTGNGGRTATLEALDGAERLRGQVTLPMVVGYDLPSDQQGGLNSQWVIDRILRSGGFNASPPTRPETFFSATLHGSFAAEVGTCTSVFHEVDDGADGLALDPGEVPYTQGQWGLAPTPSAALYIGNYSFDGAVAQTSGTSVVMSGWMNVPAERLSVGAFTADAEIQWFAGDGGPDQAVVTVRVDDSGDATLAASVDRSTGSVDLFDIAISPGWHYVAAQIVFVDGTHVMVRYRVDGTTSTGVSTVIAAYAGSPPAWDTVGISGLAPCEAVQMFTAGTSEPAWDDAFSPTAILEPGLLQLVTPPTTTAPDAWGMAQEVVAAEYGTLTFDGQGRARFRNRRHWRESPDALTVQRTISAEDCITDLSAVEVSDQVRTRVQVPFQPLTIQPPSILWQQTEQISIPPRGSVTRFVDLGQDTAWNVDTTGWVIPAGGALGTDGQGKSGYRASSAADGSGQQVTRLNMLIEPFANTIKVTWSIPTVLFETFLVTPANSSSPNGGGTYPAGSVGQPSSQIVGQRITASVSDLDTDDPADPSRPTGAVAEALAAGADPDTARLYTAPSSPWRQGGDDAQGIADDLLEALRRPLPQIQGLTIVADPSLELGDRVQVQDPALVLDDPMWIVGLSLRFDASGMTQSLTTRPVTAPGSFLFGVAGRDIVGVTPL